MPAEWEPHQATWLSWPHNPKSWPGRLERVWPRYAEMVAVLARFETIHINVNDSAMERQAQKNLQEAGAMGKSCFTISRRTMPGVAIMGRSSSGTL